MGYSLHPGSKDGSGGAVVNNVVLGLSLGACSWARLSNIANQFPDVATKLLDDRRIVGANVVHQVGHVPDQDHDGGLVRRTIGNVRLVGLCLRLTTGGLLARMLFIR